MSKNNELTRSSDKEIRITGYTKVFSRVSHTKLFSAVPSNHFQRSFWPVPCKVKAIEKWHNGFQIVTQHQVVKTRKDQEFKPITKPKE